jgi:hypothetical protein
VIGTAVLAPLLFVLFAMAFAVAGLGGVSGEAPGTDALALGLAVCALEAVALALLVPRLSGSLLQAAGAVGLLLFGAKSFLTQVETVLFVRDIPLAEVARIVLGGLLYAVAAAPLAVRLLRPRGDRGGGPLWAPLPLPTGRERWLLRLAGIAGLYVLLYYGFGYGVAWVRPEVREFYGGGELLGVSDQVAHVLQNETHVVAFQLVRAMVWVGIALPALRLFRGPRWRAGVAVAAAYATFMNAQLLLPNPYMPEAVRMAHLLETATSNAVFGCAVVWILTREGQPPRPVEATA